MYTNYIKLVNECVDNGHERGVALFIENLEIDLQKEALYEEFGLESILEQQFVDAGVELINEGSDEDITEEELDAMLDDIESN